MTGEHGRGPPHPGNKRAPASSTLDEALKQSAGRHDTRIVTHRSILRLRCSSCGVRAEWGNLASGCCGACSRGGRA